MEVLWMILYVSSFLWINIAAQKHHRLWEKGFSDQYKSENNLGHYAFGYNEDHTSGGSFRREIGDQFGNKIGSYGLRISDGRMRIVNYVADHNGYRADVVSNEPGVASQKYSNSLEVTKKSLRGVAIPGFSYSADPPHVTFSSGAGQQKNHNMELTWDDSDQEHGLPDDEFDAQATAPDSTEAESSYVTEIAPALAEEDSDLGHGDGGSFDDDSSKLPSDVSVTVTETENSLMPSDNTTKTD